MTRRRRWLAIRASPVGAGRRDPFVAANTLLLLLCLLLVWWRPFSAQNNRLFASEIGFALLAGGACASAAARLVRQRGRTARWIYGAIALAFALWVAIELVELVMIQQVQAPLPRLAIDLVYLSSYALLLLAAETAAVQSGSGRSRFRIQIELLATVVVIFALLSYFLLLPFNLEPGHVLRSLPWWSLYSLFDLLLLARLLPLALRLDPGPRRQLVGWLAATAGLLFCADFGETLWRESGARGVSPPALFSLYYAALFAGVLAARADLDRAESSGEQVAADLNRSLALPQFSPVLAYLVALPLLHLLHESVAPTPASHRTARDLLVFATTSTLCLLAAGAWRSFRHQHERLLAASERTAEALARARHLESVGRLAAGVAHDFNNRLTVILGFASHLRGRTSDDAGREKAVLAITEAAGQASRLTMELLAIGQMQAARPERLDLVELTDELAREMRQLTAPGVAVETRCEASSLPIDVDRMHLLRIIWNLAANASDAMPEGGTIELIVGARQVAAARDSTGEPIATGEYALLAVVDRGIGMGPEAMSRLFDPFFTTKEFGKGSGLGLAAVLGLTRLNGGFVLVESEPGEGSRFEVLFPLHRRESRS